MSNATLAPPAVAPPHNIELEQALLGAILLNNAAATHVTLFLQARHFFEPIHGRIYEIVTGLIRAGKIASPITVRTFLPSDLDVAGLTIARYLARLSSEATTVINAPDYGQQIYALAQRRRMIEIGKSLAETARNADHDSDHRALASSTVEALAEVVTGDEAERAGTMLTVGAAMKEFIEHVTAISQGTAKDDTISTGLPDLDRLTGGMKRGSLVVLAGRPGMGKTTTAASIARHSAHLGYGVAFFTLEMPRMQIMPRLLSDELYNGRSLLTVERIAKAKFDAVDFDRIIDAAREIERLTFVIDDAPSATIGSLLAKTQAIKARFERVGRRLDLVVVDYLKFIRGTDRYAGQRHYEVGEITAGLKQLARQARRRRFALRAIESTGRGAHRPATAAFGPARERGHRSRC